jgi:hypothetical protein
MSNTAVLSAASVAPHATEPTSDMDIARKALMAVAIASAKCAQKILEEDGQPRIVEAVNLINAASCAVDVASRSVTSLTFKQGPVSVEEEIEIVRMYDEARRQVSDASEASSAQAPHH